MCYSPMDCLCLKERYTHEDVEDIYHFGLARGIRVVVEVDTPGHTQVRQYLKERH